jgi:hypothetical protein
MERNRWETAIRCLEIALHAHTSDDEVIAAVNGFRRTAGGTPLSEVCAAFAGGGDDGRALIADLVEWRKALDRLNRENLELRGRLDAEQRSRIDAIRRQRDAEREIRELRAELAAAQRRAGALEREIAEIRTAYVRRMDGASPDGFEPAARVAAQRETPRPPAPFQQVLAAALGPDRAAAIVAPPPAMDRARDGGVQRTGWTA